MKQALDDFSYYVFKCGYDALCLMNLETREYIALDEYGILWFYTSSQSYGQILEDTGFTHHKTPLVTEGGCYVSTLPDQDEYQTAFIERLGLESDSN